MGRTTGPFFRQCAIRQNTFNPRELLARIKAVVRRTAGAGRETSEGTLTFAGWRLAVAQRELRDPEGVLVPLISGEFDLLLAFLERPERSRSAARSHQRRDALPFDRSIDVQLSRLRRKIEIDPQNPKLIKTVRGGGYMLAQPVRR
jgi:two-component system OmpR family response regulator